MHLLYNIHVYIFNLQALPSLVRSLGIKEHEVVLPVVVISELEGKRHHPELGYFARQALRLLDDLRIKAGRLDADDAGKDEDTLRAEYRKIAERRIRLGLLLSEIGRTNNIQVGQDELMQAMRTEASRYPGQEKQVFEFFQKNPQALENLRAPIFEEKVVDFMLELAKVTDTTVSAADLQAA